MVVWEEDGRVPDAIVELMSPSTAAEDLGRKKELYERTFRTPDYFAYDPDGDTLYGWRLLAQSYTPLAANADGRPWSAALEAWVGRWSGDYLGQTGVWLRLFDGEGRLLPTQGEAGESTAVAEQRHADQLAAQNERLRSKLARLRGE